MTTVASGQWSMASGKWRGAIDHVSLQPLATTVPLTSHDGSRTTHGGTLTLAAACSLGHLCDVHIEAGLRQKRGEGENFEAVAVDLGVAEDAGFALDGLLAAVHIG
jgi:hypothetical protein